MHLAVTIPEELLTRLRAGALDVVLAPIMEPAERGPHNIVSARFKRACSLLDVIGWQSGEACGEIVIDMIEHGPALHDALNYALKDALRDLRKAEHADALIAVLDREAAKHAPWHCRTAGRLAGLCGRLTGRTRRSTSARRSTRGCHIA